MQKQPSHKKGCTQAFKGVDLKSLGGKVVKSKVEATTWPQTFKYFLSC